MVWLPFPFLGGVWHCFSHIISILSPYSWWFPQNFPISSSDSIPNWPTGAISPAAMPCCSPMRTTNAMLRPFSSQLAMGHGSKSSSPNAFVNGLVFTGKILLRKAPYEKWENLYGFRLRFPLKPIHWFWPPQMELDSPSPSYFSHPRAMVPMMWKFPTKNHGFGPRGCWIWTGDGINQDLMIHT